MNEALERLDRLMRELIEADQSGAGIEPLHVAGELGKIRQVLFEAPVVLAAEGGRRHFRCGDCGTIVHGADPPDVCPNCGKTKFFVADIQQPFVESGAG